MSNSLIALLAVLAWIPFTLFYFRAEFKTFRRSGGASAPPEAETLNIESCLGASKQASVVPEPVPAAPVPAPVVSVPHTEPTLPPPVEEELPFYMTSGGSMEMVHVDDEDDLWEFEKEDMRQSEMEEEKLETVERALREPFRSEEEDRRIANDLHALQPFEVFNTLVRDAHLRTQEILDKYPPPPPEPLPEEEEPLDDVGTEKETIPGDSTEGEINDFLDNF